MSENRSKKNTQSNAPMIATIVVAVAAIAAVIALIAVLNAKQDSNASRSDNSEASFRPTQELADECGIRAHDLVGKSYEIIKLFVTEGLPHFDEPYGNEPEDGIYTVNSAEYNSMEQIEALVKSVYVDAEAERILHNLDGNGLEIYKNREILTDAVYTDDASGEISETGESSESSAESRPAYVKQTVLGISADFKPDTSYNKAWATSRIEVVPISETQCHLTIYLGADENTDLSAVAPGSILETAMVKRNGDWLLSVFVY